MSSSADTVSTAAPRRRSRVPFWAQVLAGLVLGALLGWAARTWSLDGLTTTLDVVGSAFVSLLRTVVVPLVFLAIVVSVARLR
ncbi:MAG: cation:dicarboxylate symporter family transporter, partial [Phycicoccus sp.]